jgi:3-oxoacyl-[acyl-carrier protein] reductase
VARFEGLDILINNAGLYHFYPFENITESDFYSQMGTNVLGPLLCIQQAIPMMKLRGGGVILNVGSTASKSPSDNTLVYSATKAAVDNIAHGMAPFLGKEKIRINTLAPGPTITEGTQALGLTVDKIAQSIATDTALGRLGEPIDIAQIALFLVSDEAKWITGERIVASGGFMV